MARWLSVRIIIVSIMDDSVLLKLNVDGCHCTVRWRRIVLGASVVWATYQLEAIAKRWLLPGDDCYNGYKKSW